MAYRTISTQELVDKFRHALNAKWGYIWGKAGVEWTEDMQRALDQTTDADRQQSREYGRKWIGHYVADCSGLFSWAFKQLGSYMYHGSNTMWNKYCTAQGELKKGKRTDGEALKPGTAVFTRNKETGIRGHVGLYTGNGEVIEAQSSYAGVVKSKVTNSKWVEWGELKHVDYAIGTPTDLGNAEQKTRLIRYGCKGDDVKELQKMLNDAGYSVGEADGAFGKNTLSAVRNFQGSRGLKVDGIVGEQTMSVLKAAVANQPKTYTATIPDLTQEEAVKLRALYPQAVIQ